VLPVSSSRFHLVVAARGRHLGTLAVFPLPATPTAPPLTALVPVLDAVRWRRRGEGGVDTLTHADRGSLH